VEFKRTITVDAPIDDVWGLVDDVEAVAACIPGVSDLVMLDGQRFRCVLTQNVGAVTARFDLETTIEDVEPRTRVVAVSRGFDRKLASDVRSRQSFQFSEVPEGGTRVDVSAEYRITGRIATFGHRILTAKAEQLTMQTVERITRLLEERRGSRATG
jgi:uncharacterized protein